MSRLAIPLNGEKLVWKALSMSEKFYCRRWEDQLVEPETIYTKAGASENNDDDVSRLLVFIKFIKLFLMIIQQLLNIWDSNSLPSW